MSCEVLPIVRSRLFYAFAIFLIVVSFVMCYIGLIIFLYCSLLVPFTYVITMLSYISLDYRWPIAESIAWCIYAIPLIDLLLSLDFQIIFSFFREPWHNLSIAGVRRYLQTKLDDPHHVRFTCLRFGVFAGLYVMMFILLVIVLQRPSRQRLEWFTLAIGLISTLVAALSFFKNLGYPWLALFRILCGKTAGREDTTTAAIGLDQLEAPAEDGGEPEKEGKKEYDPSMFDLCLVWEMDDWGKFVDVVLEPVQERNFGVGLILAIVACGIQLAYLIIDLVAYRDLTDPVIAIVFRVLFNVYAFPFVALCNVSTLFTKWRPLTVKHRDIRRVKIVTCLFIAFVFVLLIVYSIIVTFFFKPLVLTDFHYIRPTGTRVTNVPESAVCEMTVGGWTLLELAGFSMVAQQLGTNYEDVAVSMFQYFWLNDNYSVKLMNNPMSLPSLYVESGGRPRGVLAIQGVASKRQLGILFENILAYWYEVFIGSVVPFFAAVQNMFLGSLLTQTTVFAQRAFLGLTEASPEFFKHGRDSAAEVCNTTGKCPIFTGHMSGGFMAKGLAVDRDGDAVAFEAPRYIYSRLSAEIHEERTATWNIVNVFSDTSLFSMTDVNVTDNIKLPGFQSVARPANPYETFCLIAAGCVRDDTFDHLCTEAIGEQQFKTYFEGWRRSRIDVLKYDQTQELDMEELEIREQLAHAFRRDHTAHQFPSKLDTSGLPVT
jgi:hypothetical protein